MINNHDMLLFLFLCGVGWLCLDTSVQLITRVKHTPPIPETGWVTIQLMGVNRLDSYGFTTICTDTDLCNCGTWHAGRPGRWWGRVTNKQIWHASWANKQYIWQVDRGDKQRGLASIKPEAIVPRESWQALGAITTVEVQDPEETPSGSSITYNQVQIFTP